MKKLERKEMKNLMGGRNAAIGVQCTASASCNNGHTVSCSGQTGFSNDGYGSGLGCSSHDGISVTCYSGGSVHTFVINHCVTGIYNSL